MTAVIERVPWLYLAGVIAATTASITIAALLMTRLSRRATLETIRRL
ncbi:MAG TPA: hypothetical protein VIP09_12275 [Dehalococcoidia bacterium]